jgi:hypothetical protein
MRTSFPHKRISVAISLSFAFGLAHSADTQSQNIVPHQIVSYAHVRNELAATLQSALVDNQSSTKYRVYPVIGPMYPIGAAIDPNNPLDLETRRCVVAPRRLPTADPWGPFPSWTSNENVDMGAGIPARIAAVLVSIGIHFHHAKSIEYQLTDISQVLIAKDDFYSLVASKICLKQLQAHPGGLLLVRGLIIGREDLRTAGGWGAAANAHVFSRDVSPFTLSYDTSGDFELKDTTPIAKFMILTKVLPPDRGSIENSLVLPTDRDLAHLSGVAGRR